MEAVRTWTGHERTLYAAAFAPSGRLLATACADGRIVLYDVERPEPLRAIEAGHRVDGLAFSADGTLLYGGGAAGVQTWTVATGEPGEGLEGMRERVRGMCTDPERTLLAAAGAEGVRVWDLRDGKLLCTVGAEHDDSHVVALHPGRRLLAAGAADGRVRVWDLATRALLQTAQAHRGRVYGLSFRPDGTTLASGGEDALVKLWRVRPPT